MKKSIRNPRFTLGIILFLLIILLLSVLSDIYLNKLAGKTAAILEENHNSVVYARDMSEQLTIADHELSSGFISNKLPDTLAIGNALESFSLSLQLEKNNITESGENNIVISIDKCFNEYRFSLTKYIKSPESANDLLSLQNKFKNLYNQLNLLSRINGKAIEEKTNDAKVAAKKASIQMSFIGAICFMIAYGFTFSFASYFNDRFYDLYNGINEIVASNYNQRLYIKGKDEIYEISLIFNEMAEKLADDNRKKDLSLQEGSAKINYLNAIQELKGVLVHMKSIEEQALMLIAKFENKND
jgi:two-component system, NtrC family, sensor histidine kinase KinB